VRRVTSACAACELIGTRSRFPPLGWVSVMHCVAPSNLKGRAIVAGEVVLQAVEANETCALLLLCRRSLRYKLVRQSWHLGLRLIERKARLQASNYIRIRALITRGVA
jgi:hypothetical protein